VQATFVYSSSPSFLFTDNAWAVDMKHYFVYIMSSSSGTLYIGMTNDLARRVYQHKSKAIEGFTKKYGVTRLVDFETHNDVHVAIAREKQLKHWRRSKKIALIESLNPTWSDLSEEWDE
jgi:putative endonuclease